MWGDFHHTSWPGQRLTEGHYCGRRVAGEDAGGDRRRGDRLPQKLCLASLPLLPLGDMFGFGFFSFICLFSVVCFFLFLPPRFVLMFSLGGDGEKENGVPRSDSRTPSDSAEGCRMDQVIRVSSCYDPLGSRAAG